MQDLRAGRDTCPVHGITLNGFETFTFCNLCDNEVTVNVNEVHVPYTCLEVPLGTPVINSLPLPLPKSTLQAPLPDFIDSNYFTLPQTAKLIQNNNSTVITKGTHLISLSYLALVLDDVKYVIRKMNVLHALTPNTWITHKDTYAHITHLVKKSRTTVEVNGVLHEII